MTWRILIVCALAIISVVEAEQLEISPYLPQLEAWKHIKSNERGDMAGSEVPRIPELLFRLNVSASIDGVSTPIVESGKIFIADKDGICALNANNGEFLWGVDVTALKHTIGSTVDLEKKKRARQGWDIAKSRFLELGTFVAYFGYAVGKNVYLATTATQKLATADYEEPVIVAIDKESGEVLWLKKFGRAGASASGNLLVHEGYVCTGEL